MTDTEIDKSGIQEYEGIVEEGKKKGERYKSQMRYIQFNKAIIWTAYSKEVEYYCI